MEPGWQYVRGARSGLHCQSEARGRSYDEPSRTAFPPMRKLARGRDKLARGSGEPLSAGERKAAMDEVFKDIHAASTLKPQESKLRTIRKFLAYLGLPLVPFTTEVEYALGAALKWAKYRTVNLYLYMARATAEGRGAEISRVTQRAMTDVIRSCKQGLGQAKSCEGLVLEIFPTLPGGSKAWSSGGPWRPRAALILGSWWVLREVEFAGAELRSVTFNTVQKSASWTLPASKADPTALGETVSHGCCCSMEAHRQGANPLCPYHLLLRHVTAYFGKLSHRFDRHGWAKMGFPLFPDQHGGVCIKYGVTVTIQKAAQLGSRSWTRVASTSIRATPFVSQERRRCPEQGCRSTLSACSRVGARQRFGTTSAKPHCQLLTTWQQWP